MNRDDFVRGLASTVGDDGPEDFDAPALDFLGNAERDGDADVRAWAAAMRAAIDLTYDDHHHDHHSPGACSLTAWRRGDVVRLDLVQPTRIVHTGRGPGGIVVDEWRWDGRRVTAATHRPAGLDDLARIHPGADRIFRQWDTDGRLSLGGDDAEFVYPPAGVGGPPCSSAALRCRDIEGAGGLLHLRDSLHRAVLAAGGIPEARRWRLVRCVERFDWAAPASTAHARREEETWEAEQRVRQIAAAKPKHITTEAADLLRRVQAVYDGVNTLRLVGRSVAESRYGTTPSTRQTYPFTAYYAAPNRFRLSVGDLSWEGMGRHHVTPYQAEHVCDGTEAVIYSNAGGRVTRHEAVVAPGRIRPAATGRVSGILQIHNPALALAAHADGTDGLVRYKDVELGPREEAQGRDCVQLLTQDRTGTTAYLFDAETLLLLRTRTEYAGSPNAANSIQFVFECDEVAINGPIPAGVFEWKPPATL